MKLRINPEYPLKWTELELLGRNITWSFKQKRKWKFKKHYYGFTVEAPFGCMIWTKLIKLRSKD